VEEQIPHSIVMAAQGDALLVEDGGFNGFALLVRHHLDFFPKASG
jgi:hypothetical protein